MAVEEIRGAINGIYDEGWFIREFLSGGIGFLANESVGLVRPEIWHFNRFSLLTRILDISC